MQANKSRDAGKAPAERSNSAQQKVDVAPATASVEVAPMTNLVGLQRLAGNQAVSEMVRKSLQRVQVDASVGETLYNREDASGQATARQYSVSGNYEMTRQDDTGVTVTVKILFMNQSRNTVAPTPPATTPRLGQLMGSPTEIPSSDPRRQWATDMSQSAVTNWNGRLTFVGVERNVIRANTHKRLPVTFRAVPTFDSSEDVNATVIVHPSQGRLCFSIAVEGIELPAAAAHVHVGARDVAGPVVVGLTPPDATGSSAGCVTAEPAVLRAIKRNPFAYYVNVHTTSFPDGAVRGQLHRP